MLKDIIVDIQATPRFRDTALFAYLALIAPKCPWPITEQAKKLLAKKLILSDNGGLKVSLGRDGMSLLGASRPDAFVKAYPYVALSGRAYVRTMGILIGNTEYISCWQGMSRRYSANIMVARASYSGIFKGKWFHPNGTQTKQRLPLIKAVVDGSYIEVAPPWE
jgi:hypothetical protein